MACSVTGTGKKDRPVRSSVQRTLREEMPPKRLTTWTAHFLTATARSATTCTKSSKRISGQFPFRGPSRKGPGLNPWMVSGLHLLSLVCLVQQIPVLVGLPTGTGW